MLAEQNIAHIFGDRYSNLVARKQKISWEASLFSESNEHASVCFEDMYRPQSAGGVCTPIVGYEVLQKRKTCTMFKINVIMETRNWFVFRTYTDFVLLDKELRKSFPGVCVKLPTNSIFRNKYTSKFLERRLRDLQLYMDVLMQHDEMSNCPAIRDFLDLDDPPGPFNDLMQSKAYCEQMEENVMELNKKIKELETELDSTKLKLDQSITQNKMIESVCAEEIKKNNRLILEKNELLNGLEAKGVIAGSDEKQLQNGVHGEEKTEYYNEAKEQDNSNGSVNETHIDILNGHLHTFHSNEKVVSQHLNVFTKNSETFK